jgi:DNA-binding winged helix-turn-helix (wHTH) protein
MQFVFGDYVLEPDRRELSRGPKPAALGPQVFDLPLYLVQHRECVVSKDELLDAVWDGRIVSESTMTSHINAVRRALGDNGVPSGCMHAACGSGVTRSDYDAERHDV